MVDVDINVVDGIIFQITLSKIAKSLIQEGCLEYEDCEAFLGNLIEKTQSKYKKEAEFYYRKCRRFSSNNYMLKDFMVEHIKDFKVGSRLEGPELLKVIYQFEELYGRVYYEYEYSMEKRRFITEEEDEEFDDECDIWACMDEYNCALYGESFDDEEAYLYGGIMREVVIGSGFIVDALKKVGNSKEKRNFIMMYIRQLMSHVYGMDVIGCTTIEDGKIKLLVLSYDRYYDDQRYVYVKTYIIPKLILKKKYIEKYIL